MVTAVPANDMISSHSAGCRRLNLASIPGWRQADFSYAELGRDRPAGPDAEYLRARRAAFDEAVEGQATFHHIKHVSATSSWQDLLSPIPLQAGLAVNREQMS